ncbi:MAG TPA: acyltransferase family protein [Streptosporangiaceae bacterium]|jgi:peptidoglycan/LPS O-acetylase OafA/YrhL|nr:acyltransferase family protein [Streptosporangiaceae bacterium]
MPEPVRTGQRYMPGLDGLRALAVLAVIAYHEQFGWAPGGLLGVGVFFTLSGYLITDLLLGQWVSYGRLKLGDFWLRRARRLLPALFVMLAVVTAWVTIADRARLAGLRSAVAAAAAYSSNWYLIAAHSSYFARFAPPAPLDHLWSLAVEEQFYLVWPWLILLAVFCLRSRRLSRIRWLVLPTLAMAAASAFAMLKLYHPGLDPTRVYEGTDTRACGLLIGAALAMVWPSRRPGKPAIWTRVALDGAGTAGLAVIGLMIWRVGQYSSFTYRGGLVVLSVATAMVLAAAACQGSVVGRALGWGPLRWIGVRSYGIYLWHYPIIVLTTPANSTENLTRAALQVAASIGLAALSWKFVEEPIRHGALGRMWQRARSLRWRPSTAGFAGLAAVTGSSGVLIVACAGLAGAFPAPASGSEASGAHSLGSASLLPPASGATGNSTTSAGSQGGGQGGTTASTNLRTSCRAVVHIGDSTSEGMISSAYLPRRSDRLAAQYKAVGAKNVRWDISGARSVVETLPGQVNGYDAARNLVRQGFRGCWVIALGTDDTADVAIGSQVGRMQRIERMMSVAHGEPVLWVDVKSLLVNGPYAESNMKAWNATLRLACARYPNMRIFDWASVAKPRWFISDGIHYTSAGYAARGRQIAEGLAKAFPKTGHSSGCTVG